MISSNIFLQAIVAFDGTGLEQFTPLDPALSHRVDDGRLCQALYFRGGNSADELIVLALLRDGAVMRYFPVGAKSDVHVPLRVVEDIDGGSVLELQLAAPAGVSGTVVVDLGLVEH